MSTPSPTDLIQGEYQRLSLAYQSYTTFLDFCLKRLCSDRTFDIQRFIAENQDHLQWITTVEKVIQSWEKTPYFNQFKDQQFFLLQQVEDNRLNTQLKIGYVIKEINVFKDKLKKEIQSLQTPPKNKSYGEQLTPRLIDITL